MTSEGVNRYEYGPAWVGEQVPEIVKRGNRIVLSPELSRLWRAAAEPPRCATCRHWGTETGIRMPAGMGECFAIDANGKVPAFIRAYDDDCPSLLTAPDFGCVLHEPAAARPTTEETQP